MDENETLKPIGQVIQIDEARIRDHLGEMVRGMVEEAPKRDAGRSSRPTVWRQPV